MHYTAILTAAALAAPCSFTADGGPADGGAVLASRNVRIVDFGADMCGFVYNPYRGRSPHQVRRIEPFVDRDRNGTLANDSVSGWQFSLSTPLNFPFAPWYDVRQKSARLYGGVMLYAVNNPDRFVSEGCMNANHESRDDFNFMGLGPNKPIPPDELLAAYGLWFWRKEDFLNDGANHPVTFDANSFLAVHVSRYWGGLEAGRWVVRDGTSFLVSEKTFDDRHELIDGAAVRDKYGKRNPMTRRTFVLRPAGSRWARYEPREATPQRHSTMDFDAAAATFQSHAFRDVTAVGILVTRSLSKTTRAVWNNLSPHQALALKWYAFRCDAVVRRPRRVGYVVPMSPASKGVHVSIRPVSFEQWERIRRIGVTNQYCPGLGDLGYALRSDGVMGHMETDGAAHSPAEPVRGLTWVDAIAWCNMLSEYEGLEPAYYADAAGTKVLRRVVNRSMRERWGSSPIVYWRRAAEGFRLPTRAELPAPGTFGWEGPPAGAVLRVARNEGASADKRVLHREPGWPKTAAGADLNGLADLARREARQMTMVRLPIGIAASEDSNPFRVFAARRRVDHARNDRFRGIITAEQLEAIIRANRPPDYAARPGGVLEIAATEVPYRTWIAVRRWAETRGYTFNYAGDMGSMRCLTAANPRFTPDEPVTNVCWHDALVWCNAISELSGRRCTYYSDPELERPYRRAVTFRMDTFDKPGYPVPPVDIRKAMGRTGAPPRPADTNCAALIYLDPEADGYRLPYPQEFDRLSPARSHCKPGALDAQTLARRGRPHRTRPVDAGRPDTRGLHELNGNVLEWSWSPLDTYLDVMGKYPLNGYGCFSMTPTQTAANVKPYRDAVYNARPYFGFRVVRRVN